MGGIHFKRNETEMNLLSAPFTFCSVSCPCFISVAKCYAVLYFFLISPRSTFLGNYPDFHPAEISWHLCFVCFSWHLICFSVEWIF